MPGSCLRQFFVSFENHAIVAWFRKAYSYAKTS